MAPDLTSLAEDYVKKLGAHFLDTTNVRQIRNPADYAFYWSRCAQAFLALVRDPVVSGRGVWEDDPKITENLAAPIRDRMSSVIKSAAVRAIGARLERGLQFRLHVNEKRSRSFLRAAILTLLQESEHGEYRDTPHTGGSAFKCHGALQHFPDKPPCFDTEHQRRFKDDILPRIKVLANGNDAERAHRVFLELWTYLYSHFDDRDAVLGNELLRNRYGIDETLIYTLDTSISAKHAPHITTSPPKIIPEYRLVELLSRPDTKFFSSQYSDRLRRRIVCANFTALMHIHDRKDLWRVCVDSPSDEYSEVIRHMGQRTLNALRSPRLPGEPWVGVMEAIDQLETLACSGISEDSAALWQETNCEFDNQLDPTKYREKRKWIHLLQQFLIYHGMHGRCFYFFVAPPAMRSSICTSFSVGTRRPLDESELQALIAIHRGVMGLIQQLANAREIKYEKPFKLMPSIIGDATHEQLNKRIETITEEPFASADSVLGGLPHYLAFAERLAEIARHEGRSLRFDILVADGVRRYEHLETLASFEREEDRKSAWVTCEAEEISKGPDTELAGERLRVSEQLAARIIGNYAFLQRDRVFLLGNRAGRLRAVARTLLPSSPEDLTKQHDGLKEAAHGEQIGCYLVRILESGEIQVFHYGQLILWRRLGSYIVVQEGQHGAEYRGRLVRRLEGFVAPKGVARTDESHKCILDLNILGDVIWEISESRGLGACFVLGQFGGDKQDRFLDERSIGLSWVLPHAEGLPLVWSMQRDVLRDLAIQDGATIIDTRTGQVFGRRMLTATLKDAVMEKELARLRASRPETLHWGTRHLSSLRLSIEAHAKGVDVLIVTVSSDGDIHVFVDGKIDDDLAYPPSPGVARVLTNGKMPVGQAVVDASATKRGNPPTGNEVKTHDETQ